MGKVRGFILCIALLLFSVPVSYSFAEEEPVSTDTAEMTEEQTSDETSSSYTLPYPGMLPDNPLYFLKEFRDAIIGFLISDPLKKAEFDLLQADKKIAAGVFLVNEKENEELAVQTIRQAHDVFSDALIKTKQAEERGEATSSLIERLRLSSEKHEEVLEELSLQTGNKEFATLSETAAGFQSEVEKLQ